MGLRCSEYKGVVAYLFLVICLTVMLFRIDDEYNLLMPALALLLLSLTKQSGIRWNIIDLLLFAITMSDIVSCLYSRTIALSIRYAVFSVFCFGTYLLLRHSVCSVSLFKSGSKEWFKTLTYIFYVAVIMAMFLAVASFFVYRSSVLSVGFDDTYHFRFLYRPVGYTCNVWAEIGMVLFGLSLLCRRFMLPVGFVAAITVLITFSRGVYVALAVFSICFLLSVKDNKLRLRMICILITASLAVALFCPVELRTVVSGNSTLSQRQSTEWRVSATHQALSVMKDAPMMGHGTGSYSMATDKMNNHDNTGQFTTLAPNVIVQILVEKGLVGILLVGLTVVMVAVRLLKCRNSYTSAVAGCTMVALIVKEMGQATLTSNPFVMLLGYASLAFLCGSNKTVQASSWKSMKCMPALCVMSAWIASLGVMYIDRYDTEIITDSFKLQKKGRHILAANHIKAAHGNVPTKIEQGILFTKCYVATKDNKYARQAEDVFFSVKATQKEDLQVDLFRAYLYMRQNKYGEAYAVLKTLLLTHPENGIYQFYMAETLRQMGMKEQTVECLVKAVMEVPVLLHSESMRKIKVNSPDIYQYMCANIIRQGSMKMTAKECARYGYVLNALGQLRKAAPYLRKAVMELPSLSVPWRLLGDSEKYELLSKGAFRGSSDKKKQQENRRLSDYDLLEIGYKLKFSGWYGRELVI